MFEVVSRYLLEIKTWHCAAYVTCGPGSYNGTPVALKALSRRNPEECIVWCSCTFAARGKLQAHVSSKSVKGMFCSCSEDGILRSIQILQNPAAAPSANWRKPRPAYLSHAVP